VRHRETVPGSEGENVSELTIADNLGALRSLGLIDYLPGRNVVATALLFPAGLAATGGA